MTSPFWHPHGAVRLDGVVQPDTVIALEHGAWRVERVMPALIGPSAEVSAVDDEWGPGLVTHRVHLRSAVVPSIWRVVGCHRYSSWWVYPGGLFPVCWRCGEPSPCRVSPHPAGDCTNAEPRQILEGEPLRLRLVWSSRRVD